MSNYAEYICKGAHCKCMEKDCTKFHNGDHTCPSSTPMTPQHDRDELPGHLKNTPRTALEWMEYRLNKVMKFWQEHSNG